MKKLEGEEADADNHDDRSMMTMKSVEAGVRSSRS